MAGNSGAVYQIRPTVAIGFRPRGFRDCVLYAADVTYQLSKHSGGRRPKDEALVLRDQYWALRLKAHVPLESYSRLERTLWEGIKVGRRGEGQGYSQPFALSKIAAGTRGLSADLDDTPQVVERARVLWPDSEAVYNSCFWRALHCEAWIDMVLGRVAHGNPEVSRRLPDGYLQGDPKKLQWFTEAGIRRLGRLTHIDALGMLLFTTSQHTGGFYQSYLANLYVPAVFARLRQHDEPFATVADRVRALVAERYQGIPDLSEPTEQKAFGQRSKRAWTLIPF